MNTLAKKPFLDRNHSIILSFFFLPLNEISELQLLRDLPPVPVLEELLGLHPRRVRRLHEVRPGVVVRPVHDEPLHELEVGGVDPLRVGEHLGHVDGHADLLDAEVGVGGDDGARAEVHALAAQIAAEATLLAWKRTRKMLNKKKFFCLKTL